MVMRIGLRVRWMWIKFWAQTLRGCVTFEKFLYSLFLSFLVIN